MIIDAHAELEQAYGGVRGQIVRVLQHHQIDARSGTAIAQRLGLNRQLAWQIATIAAQPSPSIGLGVIPGARGLEMLLEASQRLGGTEALSHELASLRQAIERLESTIRIHAGDRQMLALLTATWETGELQQRTEDLRRDGHRAQCALLGTKVNTQIRGMIFASSQLGDPTRCSMASYQCLQGVTRIRAGHRSRLFYLERATHDDGTVDHKMPSLEADLRKRFRLDTELSNITEDDLEYIVDRNRGWVVLRPGSIGCSRTSTLAFTGLSGYENPRYRTPQDHVNQLLTVCYTPTENLIVDCLIDRRLPESRTFLETGQLRCFDASTGHPSTPMSDNDAAFLFEVTEVEPLSEAGFYADPTYEHMHALVAKAAAHVKVPLEELIGVRYRAKYILSPMSLVLLRPLPEAPQ
ncbi:MAG: hypothetical protein K2X32_11360 [Phycisphaerales bacterium]|nr:hypothetical protein [Phycisphaerales bacterium]